MLIHPAPVSGISVSLRMVPAAVVGEICVLLGPTVRVFIAILLAEFLLRLTGRPSQSSHLVVEMRQEYDRLRRSVCASVKHGLHQ
jgi:hypothetical protein